MINSKLSLLAAASALFSCAAALPVQANSPVPIVVELFTSEGCSSCPPADALLSQYVKNSPVPGVEVIALGEHVDYWNHGGWADPFSAAKFSARQNEYSNAFHLDSVYTPQMVVDGRAQFVGSDDDSARAAIARAARGPKAQVSVMQAASGQIAVHVGRLPVSAQNDPAEVYLAVTEDGLSSAVGGGENAGRHLFHSAVVRELRLLGTVSGGTFTAAPSVALNSEWRHGRLHAVVFVQQQTSRRIVGAAEISL